MRRLPSACVLLLAGCSSAVSLQPSGMPPRLDEVGGGYEVRISDSSGPSQVTLQADVDAAWAGLMQAYQELGIPVTTIDTHQRVLGNQKFEARRRLAGQQISTFLDCGSNLTRTIADTYRVELAVLSRLEPQAGGGSILQSRVTATARSPEGASGNPINCGSTGRLEGRIAQLVQQRAGG